MDQLPHRLNLKTIGAVLLIGAGLWLFFRTLGEVVKLIIALALIAAGILVFMHFMQRQTPEDASSKIQSKLEIKDLQWEVTNCDHLYNMNPGILEPVAICDHLGHRLPENFAAAICGGIASPPAGRGQGWGLCFPSRHYGAPRRAAANSSEPPAKAGDSRGSHAPQILCLTRRSVAKPHGLKNAPTLFQFAVI